MRLYWRLLKAFLYLLLPHLVRAEVRTLGNREQGIALVWRARMIPYWLGKIRRGFYRCEICARHWNTEAPGALYGAQKQGGKGLIVGECGVCRERARKYRRSHD